MTAHLQYGKKIKKFDREVCFHPKSEKSVFTLWTLDSELDPTHTATKKKLLCDTCKMASLVITAPEPDATTSQEEDTKGDSTTGNSIPSPSKGLFSRPVLVVAIAGGTGSGKTSVASAIRKSIGDEHIAFISHDSYYKDLSHLTLKERESNNFDHPNSLDTSLLVSDLKKLISGRATKIPMYDFSTHSRIASTELVEPKPVLLVEGILIFSEPELRHQFDIKIFVDAPADIRLIRRLERDRKERGRDGRSVIVQYLSTVSKR